MSDDLSRWEDDGGAVMPDKDRLPIDYVPGSCPVRFRWRAVQDIPVYIGMPEDRRVVDVDGPLHPSAERVVVELIDRCKALQAFKDWVHTYLDSRGVPQAPPGEHGAAGCRIGDRMDWVWAEMQRLRDRAVELESGAADTTRAEGSYDAATRGQVKRGR